VTSADHAAGSGEHGDVLVVFARDPVPGRVKTRLARAVGDDAASALYGAFLTDLQRRFASARFAVRWAVAPPVAGFATRFAIDPAQVFAQQGDDLGARMHNVLAAMRDAGYARCAIVGSDMPQLATATVEEAFARLDAADLVLGPAEDGGYYLVATRTPLDVFDGIAWSTPDVLAATLARAAALGLRTTLLAPGFDVDVAADLARLEALLRDPDARTAMPATATALAILKP
jgi:rSAM/selenodomain-associated transferase 1